MDFPEIISGLGESDDAAVYKISDQSAMIFTTDFFTPIVDDPYAYGAIAAANALSDVYAMGGNVIMALNIACFPKTMDEDIIRRILLGGAEKVLEAGGAIAGGHTIDDEEPKYGLAVVGLIHPDRLLEKHGALPGDRLILTKPIGTGLITTALKGGIADPEHIQRAIESMSQLNRQASELASQVTCHAATDITGFGLIGHSLELAVHSHVTLRLNIQQIPLLPGSREYAEQWLFPAGANRNRDAFHHMVSYSGQISEETQLMLATPETSGGLLLALPDDQAHRYMELCRNSGQPAWIVGEVLEGAAGIEFISSSPIL